MALTEQLELFEPETHGITFHGCCKYGCGAHTAVYHDDAGAPWQADIMWALLPIAEHQRTCELNPNREQATP